MSLVIQVISRGFNAGNSCDIMINNISLKIPENINGHDRGLHFVMINISNLLVEFSKVFDTYKSGEEFDDFLKNKYFPMGQIVIAACKDDCVTSLSDEAK